MEPETVDLAFASNVFEHLRGPDALLKVLASVRTALRPGGRIMIMQPNVRLVDGAFWDFFDHTLPLSERGMTEALEVAGFGVVECRARFLPYTTKSRLPQWAFLVRTLPTLATCPVSSRQTDARGRGAASVTDQIDFIVPVYNEGPNIANALTELYTTVARPKRVLIVYDFDEDDTVPVVRELASRYPGLELVRNTIGPGVINAIRAGVEAARSDVVIVSMADLSDDLRVVERHGPIDSR